MREIADSGRWTIPGGWADVNQSPGESVTRELREEPVSTLRFANWPPYTIARGRGTRRIFISDVVGGAPKAGAETSEVAFFSDNEIPEDLSVERILPHQIRRMFEHARNKDLPTDFD